MAAKVKGLNNQAGVVSCYIFYCPACQEVHSFDVPRWDFNGDLERPTFSPSLGYGPREAPRCHLFLKEGRIEYCGDCPHSMAGQTIECPDWHDSLW